MKLKHLRFIITLLILLSILIFNILDGNVIKTNQERIIGQNDSIIYYHLVQDSTKMAQFKLLLDHYRTCSFISTDQVKIDKNNYVYVKPTHKLNW